MSTPWEFLGIEPTDDRLAIKRAYAGLLRKNNPQTDPEGFQRLRAAYEAALIEARYRQSDGADETADDGEAAGETVGSATAARRNIASGNDGPMPEAAEAELRPDHTDSDAERLLGMMREIMQSQPRRNSMDEWNAVLRDPALDNLDVRLRVSLGFVDFVCRAVNEDPSMQLPIVWMPNDILVRLDEVFGWTSMELDLHRHFPPDWLHFFMNRLHEAHGGEALPLVPRNKPRAGGGRWGCLMQIGIYIGFLGLLRLIDFLVDRLE